MILDTATAAQTAPETRQDTLELLLQDREWVAAQFAGIMTASGFGDRVAVGTLPPLPQRFGRGSAWRSPPWRPSTQVAIRGTAARVRSPPGRR